MMSDSPTVDSSQGKQKRRDGNHTLMPVTAAIIHKSIYNKSDDSFKYGDIELHQVKLVGVVREVQESVTNLLYKIDDMTGDSVTVRKWIDNEENQSQIQRRSECREDTYVKIYGHLKIFQENRCLVAFQIAPITDFNEITYHMIDVVQSFLTITKGLPSYNNANGTDAVKELHGGANSHQQNSAMKDPFGNKPGSALTTHHRQMLEVIMAYPDEQGISVQELKGRLRGLNEMQIRNALEFLSNEGHIYSTIDEEHFRSTTA